MKAKLETPQIKVWRKNERCLCNGRRAFFLKYSHGGFRCSVSVCEGHEGGVLENWKVRSNISLDDLAEYPNPMPAGFYWDDRGFLCLPSLPVPKENDSLLGAGGENQISQADDSLPSWGGENQISQADDSLPSWGGENQISQADDSLPSWGGENQISQADDSLPSWGGENQASMLLCAGELLEYVPAGKARTDSKYFAFRYRAGGKRKWLHIRGGNVQNSAARENAERVRRAIETAMPTSQIVELIKTF